MRVFTKQIRYQFVLVKQGQCFARAQYRQKVIIFFFVNNFVLVKLRLFEFLEMLEKNMFSRYKAVEKTITIYVQEQGQHIKY